MSINYYYSYYYIIKSYQGEYITCLRQDKNENTLSVINAQFYQFM